MQTNVVPSYNRDYKGKAEILADWNESKDFTIANLHDPHDGRQINRDDAEAANITTVQVRYMKLRKVVVLQRKNGDWRAL